MTIPIISADFDGDAGCWRLYATSHQRNEPAGERLFRGRDLPRIQFLHEAEESALKDAALLQAYVTLAWSGKAPKAKGREEAEEPKLTKWDFAHAVWNL